MRWFLRSKIHQATVTAACLDYVGSITIDRELMTKAGLIEGERVLVADMTNGARVETYVMVGQPGSGVICINGAAAHLIREGDRVIIMGFELSEEPVEAMKVLVDGENRFVQYL